MFTVKKYCSYSHHLSQEIECYWHPKKPSPPSYHMSLPPSVPSFLPPEVTVS